MGDLDRFLTVAATSLSFPYRREQQSSRCYNSVIITRDSPCHPLLGQGRPNRFPPRPPRLKKVLLLDVRYLFVSAITQLVILCPSARVLLLSPRKCFGPTLESRILNQISWPKNLAAARHGTRRVTRWWRGSFLNMLMSAQERGDGLAVEMMFTFRSGCRSASKSGVRHCKQSKRTRTKILDR